VANRAGTAESQRLPIGVALGSVGSTADWWLESARRLDEAGARFLADPYEPPWGGCRFFCVDPDGYLVEIEQPA